MQKTGKMREDFTLPHRFQVIPPGIHMDTWTPGGLQVEFPLQAAQPNYWWIPDGFQMDSGWNPGGQGGIHGIPPSPPNLTQNISYFRGLHLDSTWTLALLTSTAN